jgi:cytochrome c biogenesis protein ResB
MKGERMYKTAFFFTILFFLVISVNISAQGNPPNKSQNLHAENIGDKEEAEVIEFFKPIIPSKIDRIEQMKIKRPERYEKTISNLLKTKRKLEKLKINKPLEYQERIDVMKRDIRIGELAKQYRNSNDSREKRDIKTQLQPLLEKQFEAREKGRIQQIQQMEKNLEKLKKNLEMRKKNRDKIIKKYLDKIIGEGENLEW